MSTLPERTRHSCISVHNIVISVKVPHAVQNIKDLKLREENNIKKKVNSFFTFGLKPDYIFTFFYTGHINITAISSFIRIKDALTRLNVLLLLSPSHIDWLLENYKLQNITASSRIRLGGVEKLQLEKLCSFIERQYHSSITSVKYHNLIFPNAFVRHCRLGTLIIASSGKIALLGCKSNDNLTELHAWVSTVIDKYVRQLG
jgi:TATA-box binding protein (TBP) (component of TFIID and TFIIIB)